MTTPPIAHPPETLEGWFALHQIFRFRKPKLDASRLRRLVTSTGSALKPGGLSRSKARTKKTETTASGWSCVARLIGSTADLMEAFFAQLTLRILILPES